MSDGLFLLGGEEEGFCSSLLIVDLALVRMPCLLGVESMFLVGDFLAGFVTLLSLTRPVFVFLSIWTCFGFGFLALFAIVIVGARLR